MYSYTLSLTSAIEGVGGQGNAPAALPPGMNRYPLYRRLGGPQGRYGRAENLAHTGIRYPERSAQWRTDGGLGVQTSPPEIPKALQNRAKLNPIVKTVKNC